MLPRLNSIRLENAKDNHAADDQQLRLHVDPNMDSPDGRRVEAMVRSPSQNLGLRMLLLGLASSSIPSVVGNHTDLDNLPSTLSADIIDTGAEACWVDDRCLVPNNVAYFTNDLGQVVEVTEQLDCQRQFINGKCFVKVAEPVASPILDMTANQLPSVSVADLSAYLSPINPTLESQFGHGRHFMSSHRFTAELQSPRRLQSNNADRNSILQEELSPTLRGFSEQALVLPLSELRDARVTTSFLNRRGTYATTDDNDAIASVASIEPSDDDNSSAAAPKYNNLDDSDDVNAENVVAAADYDMPDNDVLAEDVDADYKHAAAPSIQSIKTVKPTKAYEGSESIASAPIAPETVSAKGHYSAAPELVQSESIPDQPSKVYHPKKASSKLKAESFSADQLPSDAGYHNSYDADAVAVKSAYGDDYQHSQLMAADADYTDNGINSAPRTISLGLNLGQTLNNLLGRLGRREYDTEYTDVNDDYAEEEQTEEASVDADEDEEAAPTQEAPTKKHHRGKHHGLQLGVGLGVQGQVLAARDHIDDYNSATDGSVEDNDDGYEYGDADAESEDQFGDVDEPSYEEGKHAHKPYGMQYGLGAQIGATSTLGESLVRRSSGTHKNRAISRRSTSGLYHRQASSRALRIRRVAETASSLRKRRDDTEENADDNGETSTQMAASGQSMPHPPPSLGLGLDVGLGVKAGLARRQDEDAGDSETNSGMQGSMTAQGMPQPPPSLGLGMSVGLGLKAAMVRRNEMDEDAESDMQSGAAAQQMPHPPPSLALGVGLGVGLQTGLMPRQNGGDDGDDEEGMQVQMATSQQMPKPPPSLGLGLGVGVKAGLMRRDEDNANEDEEEEAQVQSAPSAQQMPKPPPSLGLGLGVGVKAGLVRRNDDYANEDDEEEAQAQSAPPAQQMPKPPPSLGLGLGFGVKAGLMRRNDDYANEDDEEEAQAQSAPPAQQMPKPPPSLGLGLGVGANVKAGLMRRQDEDADAPESAQGATSMQSMPQPPPSLGLGLGLGVGLGVQAGMRRDYDDNDEDADEDSGAMQSAPSSGAPPQQPPKAVGMGLSIANEVKANLRRRQLYLNGSEDSEETPENDDDMDEAANDDTYTDYEAPSASNDNQYSGATNRNPHGMQLGLGLGVNVGLGAGGSGLNRRVRRGAPFRKIDRSDLDTDIVANSSVMLHRKQYKDETAEDNEEDDINESEEENAYVKPMPEQSSQSAGSQPSANSRTEVSAGLQSTTGLKSRMHPRPRDNASISSDTKTDVSTGEDDKDWESDSGDEDQAESNVTTNVAGSSSIAAQTTARNGTRSMAKRTYRQTTTLAQLRRRQRYADQDSAYTSSVESDYASGSNVANDEYTQESSYDTVDETSDKHDHYQKPKNAEKDGLAASYVQSSKPMSLSLALSSLLSRDTTGNSRGLLIRRKQKGPSFKQLTKAYTQQYDDARKHPQNYEQSAQSTLSHAPAEMEEMMPEYNAEDFGSADDMEDDNEGSYDNQEDQSMDKQHSHQLLKAANAGFEKALEYGASAMYARSSTAARSASLRSRQAPSSGLGLGLQTGVQLQGVGLMRKAVPTGLGLGVGIASQVASNLQVRQAESLGLGLGASIGLQGLGLGLKRRQTIPGAGLGIGVGAQLGLQGIPLKKRGHQYGSTKSAADLSRRQLSGLGLDLGLATQVGIQAPLVIRDDDEPTVSDGASNETKFWEEEESAASDDSDESDDADAASPIVKQTNASAPTKTNAAVQKSDTSMTVSTISTKTSAMTLTTVTLAPKPRSFRRIYQEARMPEDKIELADLAQRSVQSGLQSDVSSLSRSAYSIVNFLGLSGILRR